MRTITTASHCYRLHDHDRRFAVWPLKIVLVAAVSATTACHDDAMRTNPMAPTPPALGVSSDGTWLVNSLADPGDGACTNSECTLREAIAAAQSGERITFKSNLNGTIGLTGGQLLITKVLTINGPGADRLAVSGQNASRVLWIAPGPGVAISGITITSGNATGSEGGGIHIEDGGDLTLIGSVVIGNTADFGGGIYARGTLTVVGSTIAANTGGGIRSDNDLTMTRSTVSGNTASQGAGINVDCFSDCPVIISSSTITANAATNGGGGIFAHATNFRVFNTIIAGNRNNTLTDAAADCLEPGGIESLGYNLTAGATGCDLGDPTDVVVATSQVFTAVLEPVLAANGSSRPTHALIERGFAVDAGYCPGEAGDQRGFPRPYDDLRMPNALDACDIGAFEWQPADTKIKGPKP